MTSDGGEARPDIVVVPNAPGSLISLPVEHHRGRGDDLDILIDELLPEVEDGPGWFDAGLLILGVVLVTWTLVGHPATFIGVLGVVFLTLGCVLPLRSAWRRAQHRRWRRRRDDILTKGVPIESTSPSTSRLVQAYEDLLAVDGVGNPEFEHLGPPAAAGHTAVLEAASLLGGRAPQSEREVEYVEKRATAIEALTHALRESQPPSGFGDDPGVSLDPGAIVQAREELDEVAGFSSISRLDELTEEARFRR